jgi:hypothetical protein
MLLHGFIILFAGTNSNRPFNVGDEDFSIPNFASSRLSHYGFNTAFYVVITEHDCQFKFW